MTDQYRARAWDWDEIPWKIKLAQDAYNAISAKVKIHPDTRLIDFGGGTGLSFRLANHHNESEK
jgi:hypothetical protein